MQAKELDEIFDPANDTTPYLDLSTAVRPGYNKKVNVDFPEWMIQPLDHQSSKMELTRQAVIKIWIAERLKSEANHNR